MSDAGFPEDLSRKQRREAAREERKAAEAAAAARATRNRRLIHGESAVLAGCRMLRACRCRTHGVFRYAAATRTANAGDGDSCAARA